MLVQELPEPPESFIHLDMVFTLLDKDACMAYTPVILSRRSIEPSTWSSAAGVHANMSGDRLVSALRKLG